MRGRALTRLFLRFRDQRDGKALGRLFDATAPELLAVAAHLVHDPSQAEDVVQNTFLAAIERAHAFDASREVKFWLYGIMKLEAAKARRLAGQRPDPELLSAKQEEEPLERVAAAELPRAVDRALSRCPRRYQEVLRPFLRDDRAPTEIARELGRSPGTVRMQIHRGLDRLRRLLPVTLATGAAASLIRTRGLAAIRSELLAVVAGPSVALPAGLVPIGIGGIAVSKKLLIAAAGLVLVLSAPLVAPEIRSTLVDVHATQATPMPFELDGEESFEELPTMEVADRREVVETSGESAASEPDGFRIDGLVVDLAGRPVAGARVFAGDRRDDLPERSRTGPDGRFELAFGEPRDVELYALAEGHAPSFVRLVRALGEARQSIRLSLSGLAPELTVTVSDPSGHPVQGASVEVGRPSKRAFLSDGTPCKTAPEQSAPTGPDGRVAFGSLAPGDVGVTVKADGMMRSVTSVALAAGQAREHEVRLRAGWSLEGRVTDWAGAPIEGAQVSAARRNHATYDSTAKTRSDAQGYYRLDGIEFFEFQASATMRGIGRVQETLEGTRGAATIWNPVIRSNPGVFGFLVDEGGNPLAGWNVILHRPQESNLWHRRTITDADGSFAIEETPDWAFHLSVRTPALWDEGSIVERDDVFPGDCDVVIRVPGDAIPTASLVGEIRYRSGAAAPHAKIRHCRDGEKSLWTSEVDPETGQFHAQRLRPGTYQLSISGEGTVFENLRTIELGQDQELDLGTILLEDPGFLVTTLHCADDPPIGSFTTRILQEIPGGIPCGYELEGVLPARHPMPAGDYEIKIRSSHYRTVRQEVTIHPRSEVVIDAWLTPAR